MAKKPNTVLVIAPPEAAGTGGAIVALSGYYVTDDISWGTTKLTKFDIDVAKRVSGTGAKCLSAAREACRAIDREPEHTYIVTNGWTSASDWMRENRDHVSGYYQIMPGDNSPLQNLQTKVGFRYLVDYLSGMIDGDRAGKSHLNDEETQVLQQAFLSVQRNIRKDTNDLGQSMTNMRFEDLIISAMSIALIELKRHSPWSSRGGNPNNSLPTEWIL